MTKIICPHNSVTGIYFITMTCFFQHRHIWSTLFSVSQFHVHHIIENDILYVNLWYTEQTSRLISLLLCQTYCKCSQTKKYYNTKPQGLGALKACSVVYSAPLLWLMAARSSYPGQYWSVCVYIESWAVSSPCSLLVRTYHHAFCSDTQECTQFAVLSPPCYFELFAAKVGVLFVNLYLFWYLFLICWLSCVWCPLRLTKVTYFLSMIPIPYKYKRLKHFKMPVRLKVIHFTSDNI